MSWLTLNIKSKTLGMPVMLDALIPQTGCNHKVLYLLHGGGGNHSSWLLRTRIADYVDGRDIAVIMPTGNNKLYVNNVNGKSYHDFITCELPQLCENVFNLSTKREDRYIAGADFGGYGAIYSALKKPDMYSKVFSYSGILDIDYIADNMSENNDNLYKISTKTVLGDDREYINREYNLKNIIVDKCGKTGGNIGGKSIKAPSDATFNYVDKSVDNVDNFSECILMCGLSDELLYMSESFNKTAEEYGIKSMLLKEEGNHSWSYWDSCIRKTIELIAD